MVKRVNFISCGFYHNFFFNPDHGTIHHPKHSSKSVCSQSHPSPWQPRAVFCPCTLPFAESYQWNHAVCTPFIPTSFTQHNDFEILPCSSCPWVCQEIVPFSAEQCPMVYHSLFILSPVDGHLECFQVWQIKIKTTINIHVHPRLYLNICFRFTQINTNGAGRGLLGHSVCGCLTL